MTGKGLAEGGRTGTVRNPAKFCKSSRANSSGEPCGNYALKGLEVCRIHGGGKKGQIKALAKQEVAAMAAEVDIPIPVKPADFPTVAGEYVTRFNRVFARLEEELDEMRDIGVGEIAIARGYADILDRQQASAAMVTRMMQAAAALGISTATLEETRASVAQQVGARIVEVLDTVLEALELTPRQQELANQTVPIALARLAGDWG